MAHADNSDKTNAELAAALREGTEEGFAIFYEAFAHRLSSYVARRLGDQAAAFDIVHDAMISARTKIHQLRDDERLEGWMFVITRHKMQAYARRRSRTIPTMNLPEEVTEPDFAQLVESRELISMMNEALAGLTVRERHVYDLYIVSGVPVERLAVELDLSVGNARKLVQRVRLRVARSMEALILMRPGCNGCPEFQEVVTGWDGHMSPLWRKRISRHLDVCSGCEQQCGSITSVVPILGTKKVSVEPHSKTLSV
jgi:RNA polymerase sigma factor (sigma-70 family)